MRLTHSKDKDLCTQEKSGGAKSGAFAPDSGLADLPPDVADLARRLAALPESARAELVAMLKADERNVPPGRGTR